MLWRTVYTCLLSRRSNSKSSFVMLRAVSEVLPESKAYATNKLISSSLIKTSCCCSNPRVEAVTETFWLLFFWKCVGLDGLQAGGGLISFEFSIVSPMAIQFPHHCFYQIRLRQCVGQHLHIQQVRYVKYVKQVLNEIYVVLHLLERQLCTISGSSSYAR
jgi:hypothetical protein